MQYKTIVLQILEQFPQIHDPLRKNHLLLPTMDLLARKLKSHHEAWKESLAQARPNSHPIQISSEAMEMALQELEDSLLQESSMDAKEQPSLDRAMAFLERHTPPT